jgi:hypothetical protein
LLAPQMMVSEWINPSYKALNDKNLLGAKK